MRTREKGITTVEFAIVGALFFIVLFGIIEFGRALWVWNTLTEATRRGARVAVVCPVDHSAIARVTIFNDATSDGASPILTGLTTDNVELTYLDTNGNSTGNFSSIRYVRVGIVNYRLPLFIPFFDLVLDAPDFATTLPRESFGVPHPGDDAKVECFGEAT